MADYDSNMIKPVESLQNITGLTPAKRREERKRRQQLSEHKKEKDESVEGETDTPQEWKEHGNDQDSDGIDYRA